MPSDDRDPVTEALAAIERGELHASGELLPLVYEELRRLASAYMAKEPGDHTLQPTALVHEAYLRLVGSGDVGWNGRGHFFAAATRSLRRILVERARRVGRSKHGGDVERVTLDENLLIADKKTVDLVALDEALRRMEEQDERMGRIVTLRFFGGLEIDETAAVLGVSPTTVKRDWACARAWLYDELFGVSDKGPD